MGGRVQESPHSSNFRLCSWIQSIRSIQGVGAYTAPLREANSDWTLPVEQANFQAVQSSGAGDGAVVGR